MAKRTARESAQYIKDLERKIRHQRFVIKKHEDQLREEDLREILSSIVRASPYNAAAMWLESEKLRRLTLDKKSVQVSRTNMENGKLRHMLSEAVKRAEAAEAVIDELVTKDRAPQEERPKMIRKGAQGPVGWGPA